ncbi:23224_t:CDS:2, partial [Racocetra persica]
EGLFNKYDLKCHTNMNIETKKAKLRLSGVRQLSLSDKDLAGCYVQQSLALRTAIVVL